MRRIIEMFLLNPEEEVIIEEEEKRLVKEIVRIII
ncbi:Uncharacterised protein [uncultured archaeon]|nr:Uncharacterised protein [uncultured archaeon]